MAKHNSILLLSALCATTFLSCGGDEGGEQTSDIHGVQRQQAIEEFRRRVNDTNSFRGGIDLSQSQGCFCYARENGQKFARFTYQDSRSFKGGTYHDDRSSRNVGWAHRRLREWDDDIAEILPLGTLPSYTGGQHQGQYPYQGGQQYYQGNNYAIPIDVSRGATFRRGDRWYTYDFSYPIWANPIKEERQDGDSRRPIYHITGQCAGGGQCQ